MTRKLEFSICFALLLPLAFAQAKTPVISSTEAKNHIGESATVCGKIVAARISKYSVGQQGKPITFDLDESAPNRVFTFVSWSPDPNNIEQTKSYYTGKHVCVSGTITKIGATPHMLVTDPSHIEFQTEEKN